MLIGLLAGLGAAVLFGVGAVVQAHAVRSIDEPTQRLSDFVARRRCGSPLILLVVAAYLAGFVLHAVAIWLLPLYLAQAAIAFSLPVTALGAGLGPRAGHGRGSGSPSAPWSAAWCCWRSAPASRAPSRCPGLFAALLVGRARSVLAAGRAGSAAACRSGRCPGWPTPGPRSPCAGWRGR